METMAGVPFEVWGFETENVNGLATEASAKEMCSVLQCATSLSWSTKVSTHFLHGDRASEGVIRWALRCSRYLRCPTSGLFARLSPFMENTSRQTGHSNCVDVLWALRKCSIMSEWDDEWKKQTRQRYGISWITCDNSRWCSRSG